MVPTLRSGLIAGGVFGALTVVLVGGVGAFAPILELCFIWALGLGAGVLAVYLAKPSQATQAWQASGVAGVLTALSNVLGMVIGAVILRYVVYSSGLIPAEYLPAGVNVPAALFFTRDICVCGLGEAGLILVFSLLGGWLAQRLWSKAAPIAA